MKFKERHETFDDCSDAIREMTKQACATISEQTMTEKHSILTKTVMSILHETIENSDDTLDLRKKIKDFVKQLLSEVNNFSLQINDGK